MKKLKNIVIGHWRTKLPNCPYDSGELLEYTKKTRNKIITDLLNAGYCVKVLQSEHNDTLMIWVHDKDFKVY